MKAIKSLAMCLLVLGLALIGCAAPQQPAADPSPASERPSAASPTPAASAMTSREQLIEAAKQDGELAIWAQQFQNPDKTLRPFREKYPFIKLKLWDADGSQIMNRLMEEAKVGRVTADIFFASVNDLVPAVELGLLQEHEWKTQGWPHQPPHRFYIHWGVNGRLPAFNTNIIPVDQGPKSWEDLALPKWRDKSPAVSFSASNNPLLYAHMWREKEGVLNWEKAEKFLTDAVKNNRPKVVRGFPMELLATGEYGIFSPDLSGRNALRFILMGAPIALVPVGKTPGQTQGAGIVKNAAHPNAAKLFADWFAAEGGLESYVQEDLVLALDPRVRSPVQRLLTEKYKIEVEPVPPEFFTPENVKRADNFWLTLLGVR